MQFSKLIPKKKPFIIEVSIPSSGYTVTIPHVSGYRHNYRVDWGDGTTPQQVLAYNDPNATHTYATAGTYEITILGWMESFYVNNVGTLKDTIRKVKEWGNGSLKRVNFWGCGNLTTVNKPIVKCPVLTSFYCLFFGCSSLASIPTGLFDNNPQITTFQAAFANCDSLTSISTGLFDNNPLVTNFRDVFYGCHFLTSVPYNIFYNNPLVTNFQGVFSFCHSLTTSPYNMFDNNPSVTSFWYSFDMCVDMTGTAPPLWSRYPSAASDGCFAGCSNLSNYFSIPVDWR